MIIRNQISEIKNQTSIVHCSNDITIHKKEPTDMGESAPILLSRKKDAESIEATANITGLDFSEDKLIGGSADQTLPFKVGVH